MPFALMGISHHTAPLEIRERFAFSPPEATEALRSLRDDAGVAEAVLLSTCNRTEVYFSPGDERTSAAIERMLQRKGRAGGEEGEEDGLELEHFRRSEGVDAARHLFRVAAGLDAMVVGESEIQGQVRDAYALSTDLPGGPSLAGPVMHRLFQLALSAGRRVRSETRLGEGAASVASVAVALGRKLFGSLPDRRVLIIGAGSTSELVVDSLAREGVRGAVVTSRTYDRAEALARRLSGRAVSFEHMASALRETDLVVASTSAPHLLLTVEGLRAVFPNGAPRPLLFIDIAIPRDIDPLIAEEPNVFLHNIDDLHQIVDESLERRREAIPEAEAIVAECTETFLAWSSSREVVPLIQTLRKHADDVRESEITRLMARLSHLGEEDRAEVEKFALRLVKKLLHIPTSRLREGVTNGRRADLVDATRFLFELTAREGEGKGEG